MKPTEALWLVEFGCRALRSGSRVEGLELSEEPVYPKTLNPKPSTLNPKP